MTDRAGEAHPVLPLVGRTRHLEALAGHAAAARAGQPRLVLLDGPAGAGKTALLRAALADDGPFTGMTVLHGTCRAVGAATGYSGARALFAPLGLTARKNRASALLDGSARHALPALTAAPKESEGGGGGGGSTAPRARARPPC
ncbi:AAA family ATPase, partial [Streptomyces flavofungini]|uniref:AAA family ATPase n=1 Tax=Streptomyces flavofungini TaxID=68200 RepID=UPI0034DF0CDE